MRFSKENLIFYSAHLLINNLLNSKFTEHCLYPPAKHHVKDSPKINRNLPTLFVVSIKICLKVTGTTLVYLQIHTYINKNLIIAIFKFK